MSVYKEEKTNTWRVIYRYRMFGTESAENLHFSIASVKLNEGLDEQLADFAKQHPDTKLIIIDTLSSFLENT